MADPSDSNDLKFTSGSAAKRQHGANVSSGWIVMLLSGLIAAVTFLYITNKGVQTSSVAVIAHDIQLGQKIKSSDFKEVRVKVEPAQLDRLVPYGDVRSYDGYIAIIPMHPGDLFSKSMVVNQAASNGLRAMSIPIDETRAVAGNLVPGDRVDVVDTSQQDRHFYAAQNLQVLAVNTPKGGALSAGGNKFSVTVAMDGDQAVALPKAINNQKIDVIRSTGATPLPFSDSPIAAGGAGTGAGK